MKFMPVEIVGVKELTHNTKSFLLRFTKHKFMYKAGQFVMLRAVVNGEELKRAYSIASPPPRDLKHAEYIELIIKHVPNGRMTGYLNSLKKGVIIDLEGPFGQFILREPIQEGDIFMATGSGIAPFMAMLRKVFRDHSPKEFFLFFGASDENELIYYDELTQWDKEHENFHLIVSLSKPHKDWKGEKGYVQDKLTIYVKGFEHKQAYLCGLPIMVEQSKQRLIELGMKKDNVYQELY